MRLSLQLFLVIQVSALKQEYNNKMLSVRKNATTSNRNKDVLPRDEKHKDLCLIDGGAEVGELGTE